MDLIFQKFQKIVALQMKTFLLALLCFLILDLAKANTIYPTQKPGFQDSIVIKRYPNSKNKKARIYPDVTNENLFFATNGKQGKSYQLFLFDMDGKLVKQTRIHEKQSELLIRVEKGNYLFELFSADERIDNGSIVIK